MANWDQGAAAGRFPSHGVLKDEGYSPPSWWISTYLLRPQLPCPALLQPFAQKGSVCKVQNHKMCARSAPFAFSVLLELDVDPMFFRQTQRFPFVCLIPGTLSSGDPSHLPHYQPDPTPRLLTPFTKHQALLFTGGYGGIWISCLLVFKKRH